MKDDRTYAQHISERLGRIVKYTTGGRAEFMSNTMVQDAVLRLLQTLAGGSKKSCMNV